VYVQESPSAQGGRGLSQGRIYDRNGLLIATVAQEGMIRVPDAERTRELRQRHLALLLDGLAARDGEPLPGPAPAAGELNWRWRG
jgi:hypothetical protein